MKVKLNENTIAFLFACGGLANWLAYKLEEKTIRDEIWFWLLMAIPTIAGATYLIVKLKLLKNKSYKKIDGVKREFVKALICLLVIISSIVMFGGYLNILLLGSNWITQGKNEMRSFKIIEITSAKKARRLHQRVPVIRFTDGKLTDEMKLIDANFEDFNKDISEVTFQCCRGILGMCVIQHIEFK